MLSSLSWRVLVIVVIAGSGARADLFVVHACREPVPSFRLCADVIGKIMCYAIGALALDLVWGYCGILSLGHSLFFALGGYMMGMYLMRSIGLEGVYHSHLPDFMVFLDWKALPWYWHGTDHFLYAALLVILVPGLLAWIFGFFAFRSRVKGVYLSIITQALTFAAMLLFYRNETGFGGNNGFTDFKRILGFPIAAIGTRAGLFMITFATLVAGFLACRYIVTSKLGRVVMAVRDTESRLMFLGYSPLGYKLFVWTFSAILCGIAGALYVPQVGIINPSEMSPGNSIEMAIWVAVGGRGTLDRADSRCVYRQRSEKLPHRLVVGLLALFSRCNVRDRAALATERVWWDYSSGSAIGNERPDHERRATKRYQTSIPVMRPVWGT